MAIEVPVGWAGISRDQLLLRNYWLSHLEKPPSCSTELQYNALQGGWWRWWHPICVIYMCNKGQVGWEAHRFIHMDPCISATHHILLVEVEQFWWTACLCICAYLHLCIFAFVHICICAYLHLCIFAHSIFIPFQSNGCEECPSQENSCYSHFKLLKKLLLNQT